MQRTRCAHVEMHRVLYIIKGRSFDSHQDVVSLNLSLVIHSRECSRQKREGYGSDFKDPSRALSPLDIGIPLGDGNTGGIVNQNQWNYTRFCSAANTVSDSLIGIPVSFYVNFVISRKIRDVAICINSQT